MDLREIRMTADGADDERKHFAQIVGEVELGSAETRRDHAQHVASVLAHMEKARPAASVLVARARTLVRHGVDLRHPERFTDFVDDQLMDAVKAATVHACECTGAQGAAAATLLGVVTAMLAAELEGREG